jgi:hypothetical protein
MNQGFDRALLHRLLDDAPATDPEYGGGLSNHLPMAWLALARLGAGEGRLREFGAAYAAAKRLEPARAREPWPAGDAWPGRFGQRRAWPLYLDLFEQRIGHEGAAAVLQQTLPALLPGVAAAAFHGLIRTAAGVQAGHSGEVAQGLAHWASFHLRLGAMPEAPDRGTEADPAVLLRRLAAGTSATGLIADRMRIAASDGAVNAVAAQLHVDAATPERLARAAAFAYAETGNFTALHLVTGTHAMRVLARFVDEGEPRLAAWRWFWQAYAHGVVAARLVPACEALVVRAWEGIVPRALASDDEHVIKLVDAAREEEQHYGGADWQRAASRAVMGLG